MMRHTLITTNLILGISLCFNAYGAETGSRLVYGETGRMDSLDPYTAHEASAQRISDLLFDSLIEVGPGGDYQPALAKSWLIDKSGESVTFVLRDGVTWHSEKSPLPTFSADDVITTVRLLTADGSEIPNKERFQVLASAQAATGNRVVIKFRHAMLDPLRSCLFKILPAHTLKDASALKRSMPFAKQPIGTGPYALTKVSPQGELLFKANKTYWRKAPVISNIILKTYADQTVMTQSLLFNSLDLITYVSPREFNEIAGDRRFAILPYDALTYSFFAFNNKRGALKDKRVRQALNLALNRQEMLDAFFQGKGRLISGPIPPTSWAYNLDVKPYTYDPAKAKELLGNAGFKLATGSTGQGVTLTDDKGKPVTFTLAIPIAGESETIKRMSLAFQQYLAAVGIKLDLQFMDWLVWKKRVIGEHDFDMTIASWSFDDASNIRSLFHSSSSGAWGNNFVSYHNPEVDSLLTEADATNDFDKRRAIYQKLHAMLADDAPYAYLWTLQHHTAFASKLSGVRIEPFAFFKYVYDWRLDSSPTR